MGEQEQPMKIMLLILAAFFIVFNTISFIVLHHTFNLFMIVLWIAVFILWCIPNNKTKK